MYFFDLEDYYTTGYIGEYNCKMPGDIEDCMTTNRATKDAFLKSLSNWYSSNTVCLNDTCKYNTDKLFKLIIDTNSPQTNYNGPLTIKKDDTLLKLSTMLRGIYNPPTYTALTETNLTFYESYGYVWSGSCFDKQIYYDFIEAHKEFDGALKELIYLVNGDDLGRSEKYVNLDRIKYNATTCPTCENINLDDKLTTELSQINNVDEFRKAATTELIDVKNRKSISGYPTLNLLYDRYLGNCGDCDTNKFTYKTMNSFIDVVGKHWIDLAEQFIPATSIWNATDVVRNNLFHQQKHKYRKSNLVFTLNNDKGVNICNKKGFHINTIDAGLSECIIYDVTFQPMPETLILSATSIDYQSNVDFEASLASNPSNPIEYNLSVNTPQQTFGNLTEQDINTISSNNENNNKQLLNNPFATTKKYSYGISSGPAFCNPMFLGSVKIYDEWVRSKNHWDYYYNRH